MFAGVPTALTPGARVHEWQKHPNFYWKWHPRKATVASCEPDCLPHGTPVY
jgi:hypothetical protein